LAVDSYSFCGSVGISTKNWLTNFQFSQKSYTFTYDII
jgi:hypothetical protein